MIQSPRKSLKTKIVYMKWRLDINFIGGSG